MRRAFGFVGLCLAASVVALLWVTAVPLIDDHRPPAPRGPFAPDASRPTPPPPPNLLSAADRDDSREREPSADIVEMRAATFLHLFDHNDAFIPEAAAYCIGVVSEEGGTVRDPSPPFVRRFRLHLPRVVPDSHCRVVDSTGAIEITTGKRAIFFSLGPIRRTGPATAEMDAGHWSHGLSAAEYLVFLERREGIWVIARIDITGIA